MFEVGNRPGALWLVTTEGRSCEGAVLSWWMWEGEGDGVVVVVVVVVDGRGDSCASRASVRCCRRCGEQGWSLRCGMDGSTGIKTESGGLGWIIFAHNRRYCRLSYDASSALSAA